MKRIAIICTKRDETMGEVIGAVLAESGYQTENYLLGDDLTIEKVYAGWGDTPNLVITINLAGFSYRSSGNNSVYATLDVNTLHYIDRDVENEQSLLAGLITITMKFITDDPDRCRRIKNTYRRIHDISVVSDLENGITDILDNMDWRKE